MEKIGIVTVDYNGHEDTIELIKSATKIVAKGYEVRWFLVDNGSDTYLGDLIPSDFSNFEILQTGENKGFAGGYNFGIKYAVNWGADYILAINNDTLIGDSQILPKLIKTLRKDSKNAVVSPKILFAKGYEFYKDRYKKEEKGCVIWYGGGFMDWENVFGKNRGIDEVDKGQYDSEEKTDFVSGCCFMLKTKSVESVGLFQEKLFAYFEDVDFMIRIQKKGLKLLYNGNTFIYHKVSRTAGIASELTDYLITRNRLCVGYKYAPIKTRYSLWKESLKFLINGRGAQKRGVLDFYFGKFELPREYSKTPQYENELKYPLQLSVVTVNYKTKELTLKLIDSIYKNNSGFDATKSEIVVLDNGSEDQIEATLKYKFPQVKLIKLSENTGFAMGYNKAIRYSKGEYILLINSDVEIKKGSIEKILKFAKKKNGEAIVAGKLNLPDGSIQKSCYKLPTIWGAFKEYFLGKKAEYEFFVPNANLPARVEGAVMASFLIPRKVLNKVGYLSEKSFLYFEDIEFCRRLKKAGIKIYYYPKAEFLHHHGASSKIIGDQKSFSYLKKGAISYHGRLKYYILWLILWLGQKFRTP